MWKINLGSKIDQRIEKYLDPIWRDGSARSGRKGAFLDRWTRQERQRHLLRSMRLRSAFRVVFLFYKGRFGSGWRRRGRGKEMQGIEGQPERVGSCPRCSANMATEKWRRRTFSKVTPFTRCQLDRVKDDDICACAKGELANGGVDDILAALDRTVKSEGWLDGRAKVSRVSCAMLGLRMEGDLEVAEGILEQLWGRKS